jgi:hypothetical protein
MNEYDFDPGSPWHSPDRAWAPLMWIIGGVALALCAMLFAPLLPHVAAAAAAPSAAQPGDDTSRSRDTAQR